MTSLTTDFNRRRLPKGARQFSYLLFRQYSAYSFLFIINSGKSSAELLKRDTALKCRRGLIEKALITVADTVNAYSDKDYFDFLLTLIKKEKLNGKGEVYLSVKDKARDTASFKSELEALGFTLSDNFADINGGFILKYGDIQINGELSALIHEKRDVLTDELNKALFN